MALTKSQKTKTQNALDHHDRFKNAYFWTPPMTASDRRYMEQRNSFRVSFRHKGHEYAFESDVTVSCRNVYYKGYFTLDGVRKNRRLFAKLLETRHARN